MTTDAGLTAEDMQEMVERFKVLYKELAGVEFPTDPKVQLMAAVRAVFGTWMNERAIAYRRMNDIPSSWGTAVNVQMMVFGNMGDDCGTGVAFSRDPATGENKLYGEFLMNAQGEDVVAGIRTPQTIDQLHETNAAAYDQFAAVAKNLEKHYKDMQDMEFTIEQGKLYMLQTRNGKRTAQAALKVAVDMVNEGLCTKEEALLKIDPNSINALLHPRFDEAALKNAKPVATGLRRQPRRRLRRGVLHRRGRQEARQERPHPARPQLHQPRGHRGHGRREGHPDRHRRHVPATRPSSPAAWAPAASPAAARCASTRMRSISPSATSASTRARS